MRLILLVSLLVFCTESFSQWMPTKNDIALASVALISGSADGVREQVLYHPNELFRQHPNLNRQWWDSRISWRNKESQWVVFSDANHTFRAVDQTMNVLAVGITIFEKRKGNFWYNAQVAGRKMIIYYLARKAGFHLIYSLHFRNR